jgi:hypothetical protein
MPATIQINSLESLVSLIVLVFGIGVAWASVRGTMTEVQKTLDTEMKPVLSELQQRFAVVEDRVESLWKDKLAPAHSQRVLNKRGRDILAWSGIKDVVDKHRNELTNAVIAGQPDSGYDAERFAIQCVEGIPARWPGVLPELKTGAFVVGADLQDVLFVGGIYFRDVVLNQLGLASKKVVHPSAQRKK